MTADETPVEPLLTHSRLMGQRLYLHTHVRLAVAVTIAAGALVGRHLVGIADLPVLPLVALALVIAGYNAVGYYVTKPFRSGPLTPAARRLMLRTMYAAIVLDNLALTVAIWMVGGARSPLLAFYLLHLILSCIYLSSRAAFALTGLAYGFLAGLVLLELGGIAPPRLPLGTVSSADPLDARHALTVLVVYGILFGLTTFLLVTLSRLLRRGEEELHRAHAAVSLLSAQRRDFLHIAVHNLRSPIGVTTMFLEHLRAGLGGPVTDQQTRWLDTGLRRLDGLQIFLRDLQLLSSFEGGELEARKEEVDVTALLAEIVESHQDLARQHEHDLTLEVSGETLHVIGIERLLREAAVNYVTNAVKYTPDGGRIIVRARRTGRFVRIEVVDDGIGIHDDDRERLFTEFFRGRREETPVAGAEGTGLGLSIVKRVAAAHGGRVDVESTVDEGSTFILEIPAAEMA